MRVQRSLQAYVRYGSKAEPSRCKHADDTSTELGILRRPDLVSHEDSMEDSFVSLTFFFSLTD